MKIAVSPANARELAVLAGGTFQQPQRGRADRDDPPALGARGIERRGGLSGNRAEFGVHLVAFGVVGLHRQERAGADMQRHFVQADPARREPRQQRFGEMQSRGRRRHRALMLRKNRLVVGAVLLVGLPAGGNIRRQRHLATLGNGLVEHRTMEGK